jgi:probable HAF family extracellular repeat protein
MKKTRITGTGLIGLAVLLAGTAAAQTYSAVDLGSLGGQGAPAAINNNGQVVGFGTMNGGPQAFLYNNGTINGLGTLSSFPSPYSFGTALNNQGQVVGASGVTNGTNGTYQAFLYSDGSLIDLDLTDFESAATGINSLGQIVGYAATTSGGGYFAALFSGGQAINLGAIDGSTYCQANGINENGQVVGLCEAGGNDHAFLYSRGNMIDMGILAGFSASRALAINNRGQAVGFSATSGGGMSHAFLYSGGTMTDLGVLAGYSESKALAINNLGQIVGFASGPSASHAFLYSGGIVTDLNSLVTMPAGVSLTQAEGINDTGQIAAVGSDGHAYLLTFANSQLSVLNPFTPYVMTQTAPRPVNIESMLTAPTPAQNLAADGEAALVLVYQSTSPQPVTFNLSTPAISLPSGASAGSLGAFESTFLMTPQPTTGVVSLLVPKANFGPDVDGNYYFLALLWAPGAMPIADTFPVVQLLATAFQAGQSVGQASINLEPPPLLLVHGIWASAESADFTPGSGGFYDYIAGLYPHNLIFPVDYGAINDRSFADPGVQNIFLSGLEDALAAAAETGIAARTVDVVAHSMGGLVSRYFISNPISEPVLLHNPVHKLITIGTPHLGTALASTLVNNAALTSGAGAVVAAWCAFTSPCSLGGLLSSLGKSPSTGAISMEPGSAALESLSSSSALSAMTGAAPSPISTTESLLDIAIGAFVPGATVANILGSTNDTLAATSSQDPPTAADSALAISGVVSSSLCGACDLGETASPAVWAQAYYWLTGGTGTAPSGNGPADLEPEPRRARPKASAGPAPVLNLAGYAQVPSSNVTFQPATGSTLTINTANNITATSATKNITEVLLLQTVSDPSDIAFLYVTQSPFTIPFTPTRLGTANFGAIAVFSDNTYSLTTLTYTLQTSGTPYALDLLNAPVASMIAGSSRMVAAQAMFSDGPVNVTQAATYTTLSGSTSVLSIGSNGTITANLPGVDSLIVSYGGLTATAPVVVGTCAYSLSPANQIVPSTGGSVSIQVTTQPGCLWAAGGGAPWLTFTQASGTSSGNITLTAAPNSGNSAQSAIVTLDSLNAIITQPAAACSNNSYVLSPNQINAPAGGVSGSITVTTSCPVIASSNQSWLTAAPAGSAVAYTAMPNGTPSARNATLTIGTVNVPVSQAGFICAVSGNGSVSVTDVQQMVNEALGTAGGGNDVNGDKVVNVVDVQIVINAAVGLGCTG